MLEAELQAQVIELATMLGWLHYHPYDSRRSVAGFPDLVLVHEQTGALIFAELKRDGQRPTPDQARWLAALSRRHSAYVWRPADLRSGRVARQLQRATAWVAS
jgi:VRR-NUC domain